MLPWCSLLGLQEQHLPGPLSQPQLGREADGAQGGQLGHQGTLGAGWSIRPMVWRQLGPSWGMKQGQDPRGVLDGHGGSPGPYRDSATWYWVHQGPL